MLGYSGVGQHFVRHDSISMADESVQVVNKPEVLEVSDYNFCSHLSFLNNIIDVDQHDILMDKIDTTHLVAHTSD